MIAQREELYFEPRVVTGLGQLRWYGEIYGTEELGCYTERTVYVRDNGERLLVYEMQKDDMEEHSRIKAEFVLIDTIKKSNCNYRYGRKMK